MTFPRYTDHAGIGAVARPRNVPVSDSDRKIGAKPNIPVKNMMTHNIALPTSSGIEPWETNAKENAKTAMRAKRNIENISNFLRNWMTMSFFAIANAALRPDVILSPQSV